LIASLLFLEHRSLALSVGFRTSLSFLRCGNFRLHSLTFCVGPSLRFFFLFGSSSAGCCISRALLFCDSFVFLTPHGNGSRILGCLDSVTGSGGYGLMLLAELVVFGSPQSIFRLGPRFRGVMSGALSFGNANRITRFVE
jgi:hypothetical protein